MLVCIAVVYIFNDSCGMSAIVNKRILYCVVLYCIVLYCTAVQAIVASAVGPGRQWGPGQKPLVKGSGAKPLKLDVF